MEQLKIVIAGRSNLKSPQEMVERGCLWIRDNKESFWQVLHICEDMERNPRVENVGRDDVYATLKLAGVTIEDKELKVLRAHDRWSVISRYLLMLRPKLARVIHPVKGELDNVDLEAAWRSIVESRTTFFAHDWMQARKLYEMQDASAE